FWSPPMPRTTRRPRAAAPKRLELPEATTDGQELPVASDLSVRPDDPLIPRALPLLPIRDQVYFPHMIFPLLVGREKSVRALDEAIADERQIVLVAQKHVNTEDPSPEELYTVGITADIMQILRVPDGTVRVMLEGVERVKILHFLQETPFHRVIVQPLVT